MSVTIIGGKVRGGRKEGRKERRTDDGRKEGRKKVLRAPSREGSEISDVSGSLEQHDPMRGASLDRAFSGLEIITSALLRRRSRHHLRRRS